MKGKYKRRKTGFKPGNKCAPMQLDAVISRSTNTAHRVQQLPELECVSEGRWIRRLTRSEFSKVVKMSAAGNLEVPDECGKSGSSKILRPRPDVKPTLSDQYLESENMDNISEMRLVNNDKVAFMWNECFKQHMKSDCLNVDLCVFKEVKKGLCWKQALKCKNCTYTSNLYKLYNEVPSPGRGAKTAAPNLGLQVGLQESTCGNTKARVIIASTNTPPPSKSSMQAQSTKVGHITATITQDDLNRRCAETRKINTLRGLQEDAPINVSVDTRYNSNNITCRHKLGQSASQAIGVAVEQQTDQKQIIGMFMANKLCWEGAWLRGEGYDVTCPGHADCTANTAAEHPISEREIGKKLGEHFGSQGVLVKHVTTDGDARSAEGLEAGLALFNPTWKVTRQADTTHLGQSQFRQALRTNFSRGMFPAKTVEKKKNQQKLLSLDLKNRCHIEFTGLYNKCSESYPADPEKMQNAISSKLTKVVNTVIACYDGDCTGCRRNSFACGGGKKNWWNTSMYLKQHELTNLAMTQNDRELLKSVIAMKLSKEALPKLHLNTNTNKNEGLNRGMSASLSKNVIFSKNAEGMAYAAVDRMNYGLGDSLHRKLEAVGSPVSKGGRVSKALKGMQRDSTYHMDYVKRPYVKKKRIQRRAKQVTAHYEAKVELKDIYKKSQLDRTYTIKTRNRGQYEHSYSKL